MSYEVISADSHVIEPPDLWVRYIAPQFREQAPRVVARDGGEVYETPTGANIPVGALAGAGRPSDQLRRRGTYAEDVPRGGWDPEARVAEQDIDGVDAEVIYPTVGMRMYAIPDPSFQYACFEAYNSWVADYAGARPDRLRAVAMLSFQDVERGLAEMRRARALGMVAGMITIAPDDEGVYGDDRYEAIWAEAQALDLPLSMHILTERRSYGGRRTVADSVTTSVWIQRALCELIFAGVLERFPRLKLISAENELGWVPFFLDRMDHTFARSLDRPTYRLSGDLLPSDYFRRNVHLTFIDDPFGVANRDLIGTDHILWSSDYPHTASTWPDSRAAIARNFAGVPDADRHRMVCANALTLYGFA
jgi:predicted TIM-barrel fold metal-dependent hydrolase